MTINETTGRFESGSSSGVLYGVAAPFKTGAGKMVGQAFGTGGYTFGGVQWGQADGSNAEINAADDGKPMGDPFIGSR